MWELATEAARPYPALTNEQIASHVVEGGRLSKRLVEPECLYDYMTQCWDIHTTARPSFEHLVTLLDTLLNSADSVLWMSQVEAQEYVDPARRSKLEEDFAETLKTMSKPEQTIDSPVTDQSFLSSASRSNGSTNFGDSGVAQTSGGYNELNRQTSIKS